MKLTLLEWAKLPEKQKRRVEAVNLLEMYYRNNLFFVKPLDKF